MPRYWVADLHANAELRSVTAYAYEQLEQLPGCAELIGLLSGAIWARPDGFEMNLAPAPDTLILRWCPTATTAGLLTLRSGSGPAPLDGRQRVISVTVLASGIDPAADEQTITALQRQVVHELHGTAFEASFALRELAQRPLAATLDIASPHASSAHATAALADRCFAAAFFRYLRLA